MGLKFTPLTTSKELKQDLDIKFNDTAKIHINTEFARLVAPWVPMDTGNLYQTTTITADYIHYTLPYAHYMYEGIVYGPNFAILEDGTICFGKPPEGALIEGWRSPKGKGSKHPTSRKLNYSQEKHQQASAHWDKVAMQTQLPQFKVVMESKLVEDRSGR